MFKQTPKRKLLLTALAASMVLALTPTIASAETTPLTSPPPIEIRPLTTYSGYTYLLASQRSITDNLNQTLTIVATTQAKSSVTQLGAIFQLQRYTGSAWIDVGTAVTLSTPNTNVFQDEVTFTATSGYYYRGKVTHFAKQGTTTEQVVEYTPSELAD